MPSTIAWLTSIVNFSRKPSRWLTNIGSSFVSKSIGGCYKGIPLSWLATGIGGRVAAASNDSTHQATEVWKHSAKWQTHLLNLREWPNSMTWTLSNRTRKTILHTSGWNTWIIFEEMNKGKPTHTPYKWTWLSILRRSWGPLASIEAAKVQLCPCRIARKKTIEPATNPVCPGFDSSATATNAVAHRATYPGLLHSFHPLNLSRGQPQVRSYQTSKKWTYRRRPQYVAEGSQKLPVLAHFEPDQQSAHRVVFRDHHKVQTSKQGHLPLLPQRQ